MKDFSNETKNKREKATFEVILRRFILLWLPTLLFIFYHAGKISLNAMSGNTVLLEMNIIEEIILAILYIFEGFCVTCMFIIPFFFLCHVLELLLKFLLKFMGVDDIEEENIEE